MTILPQPPSSSLRSCPEYQYIPFERVNEVLDLHLLKHDQLVWTLKSKGRRYDHHADLFERARVISYDENSDRVNVRYSKGSTYRVRRRYIIPVLEPSCGKEDDYQRRHVIVCAETNDYRRQCSVHTCVGEIFLEIGCDFGPCTDRVRKMLCLPLPLKEMEICEGINHKCFTANVIGIDKAPQSIDVAKERFPDTHFAVGDALTASGMQSILDLCFVNFGGYPGTCFNG